ncbi:helix-turn-helix domain-containing protein [Halostella sp. PRR32]|uniref:helix-turn-helix domain-containing protein n=1 Tax=Halostella sp. PRR32 TaxID=3098147 RepID=UPI00110DB083|nr:helix-turn-helix domain-containing protein [Halostella sp. PRR32]
MSEAPDVTAVATVLEDDCARCILLRARNEPMSASDLSERCGVSEATIYRRLEPLREHDLVVERTKPAEGGHHYKEYRTNLDRLTVDLTDDGFEVQVRRRESMADRFTRLIEDM